MSDKERGLGRFPVEVDPVALHFLAEVSEGDARRCLNALEIAVLTTAHSPDGVIRVTREIAEESIQKKAIVYDADEGQHYDTISAFILLSSMKGRAGRMGEK